VIVENRVERSVLHIGGSRDILRIELFIRIGQERLEVAREVRGA